ncbi:MAG: heavy-metal-associated domain-containing protein, partial [Gemmatimonadales bacterium]
MTDSSTSCDCGGGCSSAATDAEAVPSSVVDTSTPERVEFRVEDMDCASCLDTIRRGMVKRPGIVGVEGSPVSRRLEVDYDPQMVDSETIRRDIGDLGYTVLVPSSRAEGAIRVW